MKFLIFIFFSSFLSFMFNSAIAQDIPNQDQKRFVMIKWGKVPKIKKYILEISGEKDFKNVLLKKELRLYEYRWVNPPVGTFYFRVAVIDQYDQQSEFSNPGELNVLPPLEKVVEKPPVLTKKEETNLVPQQESKLSNTKFSFKFGVGYVSNKITQYATSDDSNFLSITGKDAKFGSLRSDIEFWPKGESHWLSFTFDYSYASIKDNFLSTVGKMSVHRLGTESLIRFKYGIFSFVGGLGYRRMPVLFIRNDGSTFIESKHYITQGAYIKLQPVNLKMIFKTGIVFSSFPSNRLLMPIFDVSYLFSRWNLGFNFAYVNSNIAVDVVDPSNYSVIVSGNDKNSYMALYLMIGFRL